ncbi:peptidase S8/S53 domain-containing protein, partial [Trichoderma velutinum]
SFNLAWCFWYLFDCHWTHNSWSADNISLRLSANASSGHLEFDAPPYIRCDPECASSKKCSNGLGDVMKDSVFLALGKLLVEIELGMRITSTECNKNGQPSLWLTLDKILEEDKLSSVVVNLEKDFSRYRKSRNRKRRRDLSPFSRDLELSPVSVDIDAIQMAKLRNEGTNIAGAADLWNAPLANSNPSEEFASNRQLSIQPEENGTASEQDPKKKSKCPQITTKESVMTSRRVTRSMSHAESLRTANSPSRRSLQANPSGSTNFIQVLDDLEPGAAATDSRTLLASRDFFSKMQRFFKLYLPGGYTEQFPRVKICIIDTGIDLKHPSVRGAKSANRLREMKSFKGDSRDLKDEYGHGTHVAELILRLAPEAALCVAKVAVAKTMPREDTKLISEAIHWALSQDVDIISLSLGLDLLDPELECAIKKATAVGKIIVAAAGNGGLNMLRAYPASNRNVLCIHASDVKSGTSFATTVAAAIAADVLAIISPVVPEDQRKRLHSSDGMRLIFALLSKPSGNGYKYVAPWNLWGEDRSDELIQELILDTLKR